MTILSKIGDDHVVDMMPMVMPMVMLVIRMSMFGMLIMIGMMSPLLKRANI